MPSRPEVVARTMFFQGEDDQWYWQTKSLDNEIIREETEGTKTLRQAIKGFFSTYGVDYEPFGGWPSQYGPLTILPENKYQINKYLAQGN